MTKHVSMRRDGKLVRLGSFYLVSGRVVRIYQDPDYGAHLEQEGIGAMAGTEFKVLRPRDGEPFYDALDRAYSQSTLMVVTLDDAAPLAQRGNLGGYRCPRCEYNDVQGRHRRYGTRTIEELFCPNCNLSEVADSDQQTHAAVVARWRPAAST